MSIIDVLNLLSRKIESIDPIDDCFLRSKGNDNGFEKLVPLILEEIIDDLSLQNILQIEVHLGHHFPDIDLILNGIKYGVELKYRGNGSWNTNGNSVFESITGTGYKEIYLLFGSKVPKEKRILIRFAPYWQATSNIKVTHSPRFTIDMEHLDNSIFKSKTEYDKLRTMNEIEKISFVQSFLKEHSGGAKWYTAPTENITPTQFSELPLEKRNQIRAELLILFPDDLLYGSNNNKYTGSAEYLLETYFVYNKSLRDLFTSGGVYVYNDVKFPKIIGTLVSLRKLLIETLRTASDDFFVLCTEQWKKRLPDNLISENLYTSYREIINYIGTLTPYNKLLKEANIAYLSDIIL
ncbi:TPA: hypothetical protein ACJI8N_001243 [Enterococcus hirae]